MRFLHRHTLRLLVISLATILVQGCSGSDDTDPDGFTNAQDTTNTVDTSIPDSSTNPGDTASNNDLGISDNGSNTDSGTTSDPGSGPINPSDEVDPNCTDGLYTEILPDPNASIQSAISNYSSNGYMEFIQSILETRFPIGWYILEGGLQSNAGFGPNNCVDTFLQNKSAASDVISRLSTLVHECGHFFNLGNMSFDSSTYYINPTLSFTCNGGSNQFGGKTFSRSKLLEDEYQSQFVPCESGQFTGCDSYASLYLTGQMGDQGFDTLLEETVQYVNSLATGYAFHDQYVWQVSERDGILTFLWYVERYLRMARLDYPETYALISGDACWRSAILTVWGRAWLFLEETKDIQNLGLDDDLVINLVRAPELLEEIERLRDLEGCP